METFCLNCSGLANGEGAQGQGQGQGQSAPLDSEKFAKNRDKKRGKIRKNRAKEEKNWDKEENQEEKANIGKVLSLCPS